MNIDNDIVRKRSTFFTRNRSKESSILLNTSFMAYYKQIEVINNFLSNEAQTLAIVHNYSIL